MNMVPDADVERLKELVETRMALREKSARSARRKAILAASFAGIMALLLAGGGFTIVSKMFTSGRKVITPTVSDNTAGIRAELEKLKVQMGVLRSDIQTHQTATSGPGQANLQGHEANLRKIDSRVSNLESAILDSPEKVLSIPLLRKEMTEADKRNDEQKAALRAEMDRLYAMQVLILGGIGTFLVGATVGAVTLWIKSNPRAKIN